LTQTSRHVQDVGVDQSAAIRAAQRFAVLVATLLAVVALLALLG
jgi:hypothetical protein